MNKLLEKFGANRVSHFLGGGFICAILTLITLIQDGVYSTFGLLGSAMIGVICVITLSVIEIIVDRENTSLWDIVLSILGSLVIVLSIGFGLLLNNLSN